MRPAWIRAVAYVLAMILLQCTAYLGVTQLWQSVRASGVVEEVLIDPFVIEKEPELLPRYEHQVDQLFRTEYLWVALAGFGVGVGWLIYGTFVARARRPQDVARFVVGLGALVLLGLAVTVFPMASTLRDSVVSSTATPWIVVGHLIAFWLHAYFLGVLCFSPKLVRPVVPGAAALPW